MVVRTVCMARVSVHTRQLRATNSKKASTSVLAPSAGLSSRKPTTPVPSEGRFQASPGANHHPTPRRGKRLRGTPTSPPSPSEEGGAQSFPSPRRWMFRIRIAMRNNTWTCLLGKLDLLPTLPPASRSPLPTMGKDQGGKRMVKSSVQCRSFNVPSRSSKAEP